MLDMAQARSELAGARERLDAAVDAVMACGADELLDDLASVRDALRTVDEACQMLEELVE